MPRPYPPHLTAHAEPSAAAYHVYCPQCARLVGGAWAETVAQGVLAIRCPVCAQRSPVRFAADCPLYFGAYSGRAVSTMRAEAERDYLDHLLQTDAPALSRSADVQRVRVAILWHLGWLSPERAGVPAGPNLNRFRAVLEEWVQSEAARQADAGHRQREEKAAGARQANWTRHIQAEEERRRGGGPRRAQQFHQYQRPPQPTAGPDPLTGRPVRAEQPGWAVVLGLRLPISSGQLREAYRQLSKANHPDRGGKTARMQQINEARDEGEKWLSSVSN